MKPLSRLTSNDHSRLKKLKPHGTIQLEHTGDSFDHWRRSIYSFAHIHYGAGNYTIRSHERKSIKVHRHYYDVAHSRKAQS